jgi:hypothetical protein
MNQIADIVMNPDRLMFGDEAAKDEWTSARRNSCSERGTRCVQQKCFVWGHHYSILLIITLDGIIAYHVIEGSVIGERFLQFLCELLVSFLYYNSADFDIYFIASADESIPLTSQYLDLGQLPHTPL